MVRSLLISDNVEEIVRNTLFSTLPTISDSGTIPFLVLKFITNVIMGVKSDRMKS